MRRAIVALTTVLTVLLAAAPAEAAPVVAAARAGATGVGDPYFPDYGNGGYDVSHYDIRLRYWPDTDRLTGTTTILATAGQDLSSFNLDFVLDVSSIRVNGFAAKFVRQGDHELVVTAPRPITRGQNLTIVVQYSGIPSQVQAAGFTAWTRTTDGAMAIGEPEIAWWWFPSNDHPLDKATFDVSVLVPDGVEAIGNGVMPSPPRQELVGWTRWFWRSAKPMATYLAFLTIGQYDITTDTAPNGQPVINAYSTQLGENAESARASVERTAEIVDWETSVLGDYPFEAQGGVVVPFRTLGFALENQTRPTYDAAFFRRGANPFVVVHENAHEWFGDSVSVHYWQDIWLNEGFASYLEWLFSEATGEGTAQDLFDFNYQLHPVDDPFWSVVIGDPGVARMFSDPVYDRGAMTLHQLRLAVGDDAFFKILKRWAANRQYGNGTVAQFIALAERVSGQQLGDLFNTWLFTPSKPELTTTGAKGTARAGGSQPASWSKIQDGHALEAARHR